ncbi:MAG: hypothetical protein J6R54_01970 [Bacteroidaceae bacterium]|nr:hypothetical protein [Bacteroidaceae bacterium]
MRFMTINQTADYLHLPRCAVRRMAQNSLLPGFYSGSRFYVNVDIFEKKLEEDTQSFQTENVWKDA